MEKSELSPDIQKLHDMAGDILVDHVMSCNECESTDKCGDGWILYELMRNIRLVYPKAGVIKL